MDDQVLPDLQFVSQLSPSSPRVGPGSLVRTSSSSSSYSPSSSSSYSTSSSSCSSSFAAAVTAPAAAGPSKAERLLNLSLLVGKQRIITALFNWKAQTSTSDTASSQHSGQEPSTFQPNCSSVVTVLRRSMTRGLFVEQNY